MSKLRAVPRDGSCTMDGTILIYLGAGVIVLTLWCLVRRTEKHRT